MPYSISAKTTALSAGVLAVIFAVNLGTMAWNDPISPAPTDNVAAPINSGPTAQSKEGNLSIGSGAKFWISKTGDSFVLKNDLNITKFLVGQDGNTGIGTATPEAKLDVLSDSTTVDGKAMNVTHTGTVIGTAYAGHFSASGAGTTNVGLYASANGGTYNYAAIFNEGKVVIGATSGTQLLNISSPNGDAALHYQFGMTVPFSAGPNNPNMSGSVIGIGTIAWVNPSYSESNNSQYATAALAGSTTSRWLRSTVPFFSVPAGATITGVKVEYKYYANGTVKDNSVKLVLNGLVSGSERAKPDNWPTTDGGYITYGGPSDNWGLALTPDDVNSFPFGVNISARSVGDATAYIDHVRITVYYTESLVHWTSGLDHSDSNKYKISASDTLGSSDYFTVDASGNIGIGTAAPGAKLDVNGQIRISGGSPGAGKVLTSDASGLASWQTTAALPAGTGGQTLRHDGTNWIANSVVYNDGTNVGIGTATPGAKLDINGQIKIQGGSPGAGKVLTSDASGLATWQTGGNISGDVSMAIRKGWGYTTTHSGTEVHTVTYGITYSSQPTFIAQFAGDTNNTGAPASLASCTRNNSVADVVKVRNIGTTTATVTVNTQVSDYHMCYDWFSVGPYSGGADLAEYYKTDDRSIEAGDVVAVDKNNDIHVVKSSKAMDYEVMGVVSTDPGQVLGDEYAGAGDKDAVIVALTGRIPVKVSLENGPIKKGDYLTASSVPGVAMKAGKPCVTVGKALEDFDGTGTTELVAPGQAVASESLKLSDKEIAGLEEGRGKVMAFLNIDYWEPEGYEAGQEEKIRNLETASAFQREKIELLEEKFRRIGR